MASFGYRIDRETGAHVTMTVWAGPDDEHRAHCGQLTMRTEEADAFRAMITEHWRPKRITLASILADAGYPGTAEDLCNGMCTSGEALTAAREVAAMGGATRQRWSRSSRRGRKARPPGEVELGDRDGGRAAAACRAARARGRVGDAVRGVPHDQRRTRRTTTMMTPCEAFAMLREDVSDGMTGLDLVALLDVPEPDLHEAFRLAWAASCDEEHQVNRALLFTWGVAIGLTIGRAP